jgi:hypothetical protein
LANCFFTFFSSRLIAANMLMYPPAPMYLKDGLAPILCLRDVLLNLSAAGLQET